MHANTFLHLSLGVTHKGHLTSSFLIKARHFGWMEKGTNYKCKHNSHKSGGTRFSKRYIEESLAKWWKQNEELAQRWQGFWGCWLSPQFVSRRERFTWRSAKWGTYRPPVKPLTGVAQRFFLTASQRNSSPLSAELLSGGAFRTTRQLTRLKRSQYLLCGLLIVTLDQCSFEFLCSLMAYQLKHDRRLLNVNSILAVRKRPSTPFMPNPPSKATFTFSAPRCYTEALEELQIWQMTDCTMSLTALQCADISLMDQSVCARVCFVGVTVHYSYAVQPNSTHKQRHSFTQ